MSIDEKVEARLKATLRSLRLAGVEATEDEIAELRSRFKALVIEDEAMQRRIDAAAKIIEDRRTEHRPHEDGFEDLDWPAWHMMTGLPRKSFDEWREMDPVSRRDVVGMFQDPETMDEIRSLANE